MIDAEKLLGGLIRQSLSPRRRGRRRSSRGLKSLVGPGMAGAAGLGALGIAIAAFEHFAGKGKEASPPSPPPYRQPTPLPPATSGTARAVPPPPPPAGAPSARERDTSNQPTPPSQGSTRSGRDEALLLVRAMIAASNADGHIDESEKAAILDYLREGGLTAEETDFIQGALADPPSIDSILPRIQSPELASKVYAVSLLAIDVDTPGERDYLNYLKIRLGLDDETVSQIEADLG